jgi:hypothetical protein
MVLAAAPGMESTLSGQLNAATANTALQTVVCPRRIKLGPCIAQLNCGYPLPASARPFRGQKRRVNGFLLANWG